MASSVAIIGTRGYPSYYGGFETAVRKLSPYLADEGWDVIVYGRKGATKDDDPERDARIRTVVTGGVESKSLSTLSYGLTASLHALKDKPDVALVMNVANGYFLPLLKMRGIKTLVNVDGIEWDRAKWGRLAKFMFKMGAKFTAKFADNLVFDSREIERRWNSEFGREGVFIPYGGDVPPELPIEPGLEHRGYVLVVARFVPENTIPEFLDAAEIIADKYPVVIVGSSGYGGPLDEQAQALAAKNPNVHALGHISDDARLLSLWQHAGVYFHGHSVGGTNPTLVQAMATGTPIVARDTVYNREVLGSGAHLCAPEPTAIAASVDALMGDQAAQNASSESSLQRSLASYTWQLVNASYDAALRDLVRAFGLVLSRPDGRRTK
ncbi:glycosyltransferase involved in cell wall biosynthesis [Microbacterium paludicola]|uniref:Glycosyltransferase involved in cell wall biosynthesis n=1 Tax=Microbacterium paludicola TaxID=300019 RepID=A0ABU1I3C0_9MICO|nr:glycosyltransferase [Microbacterium paludicola]MDR6167449.1 glycosyltransferase involved in cell wall biosynthesis [Microbacterium paludicola]